MKKIVFLTWTRADYWKIKSLMKIVENNSNFELYVFVTWMHLLIKYWYTVEELIKDWYNNIYPYMNQYWWEPSSVILSDTIKWFSQYTKLINPDLIVIHWDRLEALAWAIVWVYENILIAHIEWWESSWSVDESVRHSISKLSHSHFVSTELATQKLQQMWEKNISNIWSPDFDFLLSDNLWNIEDIKLKYKINFKNYWIVIFHTVTTEGAFNDYSKIVFESLLRSNKNFILIYPNNDLWSDEIIKYINKYINKDLLKNRFKIFNSIPFEDFLVLLKESKCIVWNSSAWVRQAPAIWIPTINIWNRQNGRNAHESIFDVGYDSIEIEKLIIKIWNWNQKFTSDLKFWDWQADKKFIKILNEEEFWNISLQK